MFPLLQSAVVFNNSQNQSGFGFEFFSIFEFLSFFNQPIFIGLALGILIVWLTGVFILKYFRHLGSLRSSFDKDLLLVQVPKQLSGAKGGDDNLDIRQIQDAIGTMETYFDSIAGLRAQRGFKNWLFGRDDHASFEIVVQDDLIKFYISVSTQMRRTVEQQLLSQFPYAYIEEVPEYNLFTPQCAVEVASFVFTRPFFFPIKRPEEFESDPLSSLTNVLAKVDKGDAAAIQFTMRSAKGIWHKMGPKVAEKMTQGKKYIHAYSEARQTFFHKVMGGFWDILQSVLGGFWGGGDSSSQDERYDLSEAEREMVKGFQEKTSKAGLDVNIRVVSVASDSFKAKDTLNTIVSAFSQYNIYEYGNSFKPAKIKNKKKFIEDFIYRNFDERNHCILNSEEMSGLYHLPLPGLGTPKILWLLAKKAAPPTNMPSEGIVLGVNKYRGEETEVKMKESDRRRHVYIIGQTGTGKSVLSQNLAVQDIKAGKGVCVIDPHGEMIDYILGHIPKERIDDVIHFDPSDSDRPMALNLLEFDNDQQKSFVVNETIAIFDKLYDLKATGGPMFEQYMRNALLLIMSDPDSGSTLLEISKVLADENFRKYKLTKCKDMTVYDFWTKEAEKAGGEAALANMVPYITSKLTPFIANDIMRPIISQQHSCFNVREAMDNQKILLLNLSKGKIGDMNSNLLGMVMIGKILMAALSRVDMPQEERKDFYLYIDEFQNFLTDSISIILSEARKYRLCLTIAHQFVAQLSERGDSEVRDAVFGNVGTKIAYRVGIDDAETIAKQFSPVFNENDVINTPKYTAYCKMLIDNENPPAFNLHPFAPEEGNHEIKEAIKQLARLKYGRDRRIVEAEILERVRKTEKMAKPTPRASRTARRPG